MALKPHATLSFPCGKTRSDGRFGVQVSRIGPDFRRKRARHATMTPDSSTIPVDNFVGKRLSNGGKPRHCWISHNLLHFWALKLPFKSITYDDA